MVKNDFNDGLSDEFFTSLNKIDNYNLEDKTLKLEELFKEYLNFESGFLSKLSVIQLETIYVHPKIKDYSKFTVLGILFIKQWMLGSHNEDTFYKLLKGFYILSDIYLNDEDTKLSYYTDYLITACDDLSAYKLDNSALYTLIKTYAKHEDFLKVDDISFELLNNDNSYKENILEIYNSMLSYDDEFLSSKNITKDEIHSAITDIENS